MSDDTKNNNDKLADIVNSSYTSNDDDIRGLPMADRLFWTTSAFIILYIVSKINQEYHQTPMPDILFWMALVFAIMFILIRLAKKYRLY